MKRLIIIGWAFSMGCGQKYRCEAQAPYMNHTATKGSWWTGKERIIITTATTMLRDDNKHDNVRKIDKHNRESACQY